MGAVIEVRAPVVATCGSAKAQAVVTALEAALESLKVQLQMAAKAAKSTSATVNPSSEQSSEIRRIARQAEDATRVAERWAQVHPAVMAVRQTPWGAPRW